MPVSFVPIGIISGKLSSASNMAASLSSTNTIKGTLHFSEEVVLANTVFLYKGSVTDISSLPQSSENGDTYLVESENSYYAWMGERWQDIGTGTMTEDLTAAQITELQGLVE